MYTPVNPFYYIKVGFKGGQNYIGMFSWWNPKPLAYVLFKLVQQGWPGIYYVQVNVFSHAVEQSVGSNKIKDLPPFVKLPSYI